MKSQRGLTLIEMVIAISLLAIMISAIVFSFDGSRSKAQVLVASMSEYANAMERLKQDASCYPRNMAALFDRAAAQLGTNSFCGADLSRNWNGPYVKASPVRAAPLAPATNPDAGPVTSVVSLGQISPDATLRIARQASAFGGGGPNTWKWFIVADGIPSEILTQALSACNGQDDGVNVAAAGTRKCGLDGQDALVGYAVPPGLAPADDAAPGSVFMLFNETRR
jgi:prepilin-type N-terminal cleavage/methylation domain-containing protein